MPNFMLLATAWGPKHGGINAFNMDFAIGLANHLGKKAKVFCAVFTASAEDIADARGKNVNLVAIDRPVQSTAYDPSWAHDVWKMFRRGYPNERIDWWIGHDVTTGWAAVEGPTVAAQGQSALIMHMNYADYQNYKGGVGQQAQAKENQQRQLFKKGDRNFANGPLLRDALRDIVGPEVTMLVPGFAAVPVQPSSHRLHLITFGRMDRESARIKQGALAVAGFASAVKQSSLVAGSPENLKENPQMRVVGIREADGEEEHVLTRFAANKADREVNLIALPFDESRDDLFDELGRANIALMLSWHEGFGLTGWEAVAGEVPLIISKQTGLWQLLKETLGERPAAGYVRSIDVRGRRGDDDISNFLPEDEIAVRDAIIDCAAHLSMARSDAAKLKQELQSKLICTWVHTAKQFCEGLDRGDIKPEVLVGPSSEQPPPKPVILPIKQSDFVTIPKLDWPKDLSDKGFEMPDSMLLRPESRVVRFHPFREPQRDEITNWALEDDGPIKLRLQTGEGGAGKTRLLIEVCDRLEHHHGWRAGFVTSSQSIADDFPKLLKEGKPCVLVLDYAESRTAEIVQLTKVALQSGAIPRVRIVLLAREGGDWWERLADASENDHVVSAILRSYKTKTGPYRLVGESIEQQDRRNIFNQALEDFAVFKKSDIAAISPPELSADLYSNPLFIHLAALEALRGQNSIDDKELLGMALGHERSYWRKLLIAANLPDPLLATFEQAVAFLTLCGGKRTAKEAKAILARTPRMIDLDPATRIALFDSLRRLYPHPIEGGLVGLEPDLLGETLVAEALSKDDELLDAAMGEEGNHTDIRHALTVLTRLGRRVPNEQRWLKRALEDHLGKISEDALHVGMETGSPMPEIHAEVIKAAAPHARRRAVEVLRPKLPDHTVNLTSLSVEVRTQMVRFLEGKAVGNALKRDSALCKAFLSLSDVLNASGELDEAAQAASQAAHFARRAFRTKSENDRSRLALALSQFAVSLRKVQRFDEALPVAREAESIMSKLAEERSGKFTALWVNMIAELAISLSDVSQFNESLEMEERANGLYQMLFAKEPDFYRSSLAGSYGNLASSLTLVGRADEALAMAERAVVINTEQNRKDANLDERARSFKDLAGKLIGVGRFEEAIEKAAEAESILKELAEKQPDSYSGKWASSIIILALCYSRVGRNDEALQKAEQAETIRRGLAAKQPGAYSADWARSLLFLGEELRATGRFEEALNKIEQGEAIFSKLAEIQPDAHRAGWANALDSLALVLEDNGRRADSLDKFRQAESILRELAGKQPDAYSSTWAGTLANLADAELSADNAETAIAIVETAISLIRPSAERYPSAFGHWIGYGHRIKADAYFKLGKLEVALFEAQAAIKIWTSIAISRRNFESAQVAKAFRTAIKCELALGRKDIALLTFESAFDLLKKPFEDNPRPLRLLVSEIIALAQSADPETVARLVPTDPL
jgi:tetratricopeptide (TPR) repeat protein